MSDQELARRFKDGDEAAFREIVESYHRPIMNLCFRYVGNREDAEEVAQDVFIRAYRARETYEPRAKISTYLYRIAVNLSLNRIRDRKRKRLVSLDFIRTTHDGHAHQPGPDIQLERQELSAAVRRAIDALPPKQRTAVILRRYQGCSYEEIAQVMTCSLAAVEARLHRAKLNLQKRLKPLIKN